MKDDKQKIEDSLKEMNKEIENLIDIRTEFIKKHMHLFAEFPIGASVVSVTNRAKYTVCGHYISGHNNGRPIDSFSVGCEMQCGNSIDNTSHYVGIALAAYRKAKGGA